jgi:transposase
MEIQDARSLPAVAQEDLRRKAVNAVLSGKTQAEVAILFNVSRYAVIKWTAAYKRGGEAALSARRRGKPKGLGSRLTTRQATTIARLVVEKYPDQLKLPFVLWTREAVQDLIRNRYGIEVAITTVGNYLRSWGFSPQKPIRRAFEQDPNAVKRWLNEIYPDIRRRAKAESAVIYWCDEMGLRSDHVTGRSYGIRGRTPVIPGTGNRFGCNMISAVTNRGHLCFMVFIETFRVKIFLEFLKRLIKQNNGKVFLILDGHPVHRSGKAKEWLQNNRSCIEIFRLPSYSPELNPDELLNQDVKSNSHGRSRPRNQGEMVCNTRSYLRSTQRRPNIVQNYFHGRHVSYAA